MLLPHSTGDRAKTGNTQLAGVLDPEMAFQGVTRRSAVWASIRPMSMGVYEGVLAGPGTFRRREGLGHRPGRHQLPGRPVGTRRLSSSVQFSKVGTTC